MSTRYVHTNIVAQDWQRLVRFHVDVFGCKENPPERDHFGTWIDRLTGIEDAHIRGMHLSLPGFGPGGPTREMFQYGDNDPHSEKRINTEGFAHIAFAVDDV